MNIMLLASLCLALPFALQAGQEPGSDGVVDATLIIFNDEVFTISELAAYMDTLAARAPEMPEEQVFTNAVVAAMRNLIAEEGFKRLGLDQGFLEPEIEDRIASMVRESGSRDQFVRNLEKDGYTTIESFRQDLRKNLIQQTFTAVVTGRSPMPQGGRRVDITPSPEEIRAAYDEETRYREQEETLQWAILQFYPRTGEEKPAIRAKAMIAQLEEGTLTPEEAMRRADRSLPRDGIVSGMRQDWADFLDFAEPGQPGDLSETSTQIVQFPMLYNRLEARSIPFSEAQAVIAYNLENQKANEALKEAEAEIWSTSFLWLAPNLADLQRELDAYYGENVGGAGNSADV